MDKGYKFSTLPNTCPLCYTLRRFCYEHPYGEYIVCTMYAELKAMCTESSHETKKLRKEFEEFIK